MSLELYYFCCYTPININVNASYNGFMTWYSATDSKLHIMWSKNVSS